MSNCIAFRRAKLADPRSSAAAATAHRALCRRCAAFDRDVDELDCRIGQQLMVPIPDGLEARILLRRRHRPMPRITVLALAASMLVAVMTGLWLARDLGQQKLGRHMIAHVLNEPEAWAQNGEIAGVRVAQAVASVGGRLRSSLGRVSFLDHCQGLDAGGTHLVLDTPHGRASVLLLPGRSAMRAASIADRGRVAELLPAARGVVGVVAHSPLQASLIRQLLFEAIEWQK